ncbi:MAG: glycosyltransferase family 4 protein [Spirochaetota bacterium]
MTQCNKGLNLSTMTLDLSVILTESIRWVARHQITLLYLACAFLGFAGGWLISELPFRERLLDYPRDRSSHDVPTPQGGGVGILAAFLVAGMTLRIPTTFLFTAIVVSAVSLYGDYARLSASFRLVVQCVAAVIVLFPLLPHLLLKFELATVGGAFPVLFFLIVIMIVLFVVGTANFYNFMDGIDGIAGVSGVISFGLLGCYTLYFVPLGADKEAFSLLAICFALACLGFLPFNMPRAKVFMGDVGSILLGFVFAVLVLMLSRSYRDMICFAALLFPFYADVVTTMCVRLRAGENLLKPHRRHLYQLLANECAMDHWKVTVIYGFVQLMIGLGVLAASAVGMHIVVTLLIMSCIVFTLTSYRVRSTINRRR